MVPLASAPARPEPRDGRKPWDMSSVEPTTVIGEGGLGRVTDLDLAGGALLDAGRSGC